MFAAIHRCITCASCRRALPEYDEEDQKFLLKHVILLKGSYIVIVYFIDDYTGETECRKYTDDQHHRVDNVAHIVRLYKESEFLSGIISEDGDAEIAPSTLVPVSYEALKQGCVIHKVRIKTRIEGEHLLQLHIKRGNTIMHNYPFHITLTAEDLYIRYRPRSGQQATLHNSHSEEDVEHHYTTVDETSLTADESSGSGLLEILKQHNLEHIWPLLERGKLTTVSQLAKVDEDDLKAIGLDTYGDRHEMMKIINSLSSSQDNNAFTAEGDFRNKGSSYSKIQEPRPPPPLPDGNLKHDDKDKTSLSELLKKLDMENLMRIFEKEKISFDMLVEMRIENFIDLGIESTQGKKILEEAENYAVAHAKKNTNIKPPYFSTDNDNESYVL